MPTPRESSTASVRTDRNLHLLLLLAPAARTCCVLLRCFCVPLSRFAAAACCFYPRHAMPSPGALADSITAFVAPRLGRSGSTAVAEYQPSSSSTTTASRAPRRVAPSSQVAAAPQPPATYLPAAGAVDEDALVRVLRSEFKSELSTQLSGFAVLIDQRLDEKLSSRLAAQAVAAAVPLGALWHMAAAAVVGALMAILAGGLFR